MTTLWNLLLRPDLPCDLFLQAERHPVRGEGNDQHPLGLDGAVNPWTAAIGNVTSFVSRGQGRRKLRPLGKPPPRTPVADVVSVPGALGPKEANPNSFDITVRCNR
ncbi:hypothetical protein M404DRAFT_1002795 [Pisolithus tinctorius Marx 270]|uniref:Uncharacterized protein n=1 Tax=Pisolithus tinctorius Marx 270 TaxID=870435 RepID=A0A0C3JW37_PISTI|nr:hypothetical protein M404DRAFT_1002795 [Pisolithus tinctorius Marx 270]